MMRIIRCSFLLSLTFAASTLSAQSKPRARDLGVPFDGTPGKYTTKRIELSLFDMEKDPYETTNVLKEHPDVAARLEGYAEQHRREFYPNQLATP